MQNKYNFILSTKYAINNAWVTWGKPFLCHWRKEGNDFFAMVYDTGMY